MYFFVFEIDAIFIFLNKMCTAWIPTCTVFWSPLKFNRIFCLVSSSEVVRFRAIDLGKIHYEFLVMRENRTCWQLWLARGL